MHQLFTNLIKIDKKNQKTKKNQQQVFAQLETKTKGIKLFDIP